MANLPSTNIEQELISNNIQTIIGIDEVGIGCLAGPVTACAILIPKEFYTQEYETLKGIRDSKLLSEKQREHYYAELTSHPLIRYAVSTIDVATIDTINIYRASRKAMLEALAQLRPDEETSFLLIDGNKILTEAGLPQKAIVKGDRDVITIACASIIAKVTRDRLMHEYEKEYPGYGFAKHKGYATAAHRASIRELGPCPIHRTSFTLL